jgi:protein required for attachment to host cells
MAVLLQTNRPMNRSIVAVVDAGKARLFLFERSDGPKGIVEHLVEEEVLANRERNLGHRQHQLAQADTDFARMVMAALHQLADSHHVTRVILCAPPRMLGHLRAMTGMLRRDLEIAEVPHDFAKLSPNELRTQLAAHHVMPEVPHRIDFAAH